MGSDFGFSRASGGIRTEYNIFSSFLFSLLALAPIPDTTADSMALAPVPDSNMARASITDGKSQNRSHTYRFDVSVRMGPLSSQDDVCKSFKEILRAADARLKIKGLETCSFSYDVPDDGLAEISGYLHVNKASRMYESAVRTWIAVWTWILESVVKLNGRLSC